MRLFVLVFLALLSLPANAAEPDATSKIYQVSDVTADVTDNSASHARDKAIIQAQRSAFALLLSRLGAPASVAEKQTDDSIALLVQAFEIQKEKTSSVRYVGVFTIQFKPQAVQNLLNQKGVPYTDRMGETVLVLPIVMHGTNAVLWEEPTQWKDIWTQEAQKGSRVPLVVPMGDLDDVAIISGKDALSGNREAIAKLLEKYNARHLAVVTLTEKKEGTPPAAAYEVSFVEWKNGEEASLPQTTKTGSFSDAASAIQGLTQSAKQIHDQLENTWKTATIEQTGPLSFLPVSANVASMPAWLSMKNKLATVSRISKIDVIALARGNTKAEIAFYGTIPELQEALQEKGIFLRQEILNGPWILMTTAQGDD